MTEPRSDAASTSVAIASENSDYHAIEDRWDDVREQISEIPEMDDLRKACNLARSEATQNSQQRSNIEQLYRSALSCHADLKDLEANAFILARGTGGKSTSVMESKAVSAICDVEKSLQSFGAVTQDFRERNPGFEDMPNAASAFVLGAQSLVHKAGLLTLQTATMNSRVESDADQDTARSAVALQCLRKGQPLTALVVCVDWCYLWCLEHSLTCTGLSFGQSLRQAISAQSGSTSPDTSKINPSIGGYAWVQETLTEFEKYQKETQAKESIEEKERVHTGL